MEDVGGRRREEEVEGGGRRFLPLAAGPAVCVFPLD